MAFKDIDSYADFPDVVNHFEWLNLRKKTNRERHAELVNEMDKIHPNCDATREIEKLDFDFKRQLHEEEHLYFVLCMKYAYSFSTTVTKSKIEPKSRSWIGELMLGYNQTSQN
jgi:hypothetical protein